MSKPPLKYGSIQKALAELVSPSRAFGWLRGSARLLLERSADRRRSAVPQRQMLELLQQAGPAGPSVPEIKIDGSWLGRHAWNVKLHEAVFLAVLVKHMRAKRIFEIGTFDGGSTRILAEHAPAEAEVFTLDLPVEMFNATQSPDGMTGDRVGHRYKNSPAAHRVTQLRGDASTFDFTPYHRTIDLVFVDAAHDYPHGLIDTKTALNLIRPGGVIVWHDFEPYWHGLVHAICEATESNQSRMSRVGGTSMGMMIAG